MSITANVAPNINKIQKDNFWFQIVFDFVDNQFFDTNGFTLSNLEVVTADNHISTSDMNILYLEGDYAIISVDIPDNVSGKFYLNLTGNIDILTGDVSSSEELLGNVKLIEYDTTGAASQTTYDNRPTTNVPTIVILTLSAASINNGGIIIAQFDFDYAVPFFSSSHVTVSSGATKSQTEVIDDDFRRWIMLVTTPSSGSGMVQISVDVDALGLSQDSAIAQIQHADNIPLQIWDANEQKPATGNGMLEATPMIGEKFEYIINIIGNDVDKVDVQALLEPFYHHWDQTMGKLYIRSVGEVEKEYDKFFFSVIARDKNSQSDITNIGSLNIPTSVPPAIIIPSQPLQFFFGVQNTAEVAINNRPNKVEVKGTWLNLVSKTVEQGVVISGYIPEKGTETGQMTPGVTSGNFSVIASKKGLEDTAMVPWVISSFKSPQFREGHFTNHSARGGSITDVILVDANPEPTIEIESGSLPTGISLSISTSNMVTTVSFDGMTSATGTWNFKLKATNQFGVAITSLYTFTVYESLAAPTQRKPLPGFVSMRIEATRDFTEFFNRGTPPGNFFLTGSGVTQFILSISGREDQTVMGEGASLFTLSEDGVLDYIGSYLGRLVTIRDSITITCRNSQGSFSATITEFSLTG